MIEQAFLRHLSRIPSHGLGLSVDVYSPNLFDLLEVMASHGLRYGYLEIFQASHSALAEVRRRLPAELLAYHSEGLWLTQPEWGATETVLTDIEKTASHLATLGCHWVNHECATKQMAGFSFGTYLPALFTATSAEVTAAHATRLQRGLATSGHFPMNREPLVLLEIPPLTYFAFGDLPVTEFFRRIADRAPCGFVLDLGHIWTYYRYAGDSQRRPLTKFLAEFLDAFPLERVVQIHVAGLAVHESDTGYRLEGQDAPYWVDAHQAPIPEVLFDMLEQVLAHPNLRSLKGLALEVDTKSIAQIVHELSHAQQRFSDRLHAVCQAAPSMSMAEPPHDCTRRDSVAVNIDTDAIKTLRRQYECYARVVSGQVEASQSGLPSRWLEPGSLELYRDTYLPHEILHWGGDLYDMFPGTCNRLTHEGVEVSAFVDFWFREPHSANCAYDFFLLKLDRFPRFVRDVWLAAFSQASREADLLRDAYVDACETVVTS